MPARVIIPPSSGLADLHPTVTRAFPTFASRDLTSAPMLRNGPLDIAMTDVPDGFPCTATCLKRPVASPSPRSASSTRTANRSLMGYRRAPHPRNWGNGGYNIPGSHPTDPPSAALVATAAKIKTWPLTVRPEPNQLAPVEHAPLPVNHCELPCGTPNFIAPQELAVRSLLNVSATCSVFLFQRLSPLSVPKSHNTYPFRDASVIPDITAQRPRPTLPG
jgi:hypothetical protein